MDSKTKLENLKELRNEEFTYLQNRLRHLVIQSIEDGEGQGYRVNIYGSTDREDTNRPAIAILNWSATGDQTPATAILFAEALQKMAQRAADYNLERAQIIVKLDERERELKAQEA